MEGVSAVAFSAQACSMFFPERVRKRSVFAALGCRSAWSPGSPRHGELPRWGRRRRGRGGRWAIRFQAGTDFLPNSRERGVPRVRGYKGAKLLFGNTVSAQHGVALCRRRGAVQHAQRHVGRDKALAADGVPRPVRVRAGGNRRQAKCDCEDLTVHRSAGTGREIARSAE